MTSLGVLGRKDAVDEKDTLLSPTRDGKSSIEHQLSIFLDDLLDHLQRQRRNSNLHLNPNTSKKDSHLVTPLETSWQDISDTLVGMQYVLDYRIRGAKQPDLDEDLMARIVAVLLLLCSHRSKNVTGKKPENPKRLLLNSENDANLSQSSLYDSPLLQQSSLTVKAQGTCVIDAASDRALAVLSGLVEETRGAQKALLSVDTPSLRKALCLHARLLEPSFAEIPGLVVVLAQFCLPQLYSSWRSLVDSRYWPECAPFFSNDQLIRSRGLMREMRVPPGLYADKTCARVATMFKTDMAGGMTTEEVLKARAWYGTNELPKKAFQIPSIARMLWSSFARDFLNWVLMGAAFVAVLSDWPNPTTALTLLAVVTLNCVLGVTQERQSMKAAEAIDKATASLQSHRVHVLRDNGVKCEVNPGELVPGDLVVLENDGTLVPADCRLCSVTRFACGESMLTGESLPQWKTTGLVHVSSYLKPVRAQNVAYAGTTVLTGSALGIVTRTGPSTELGRIQSAIQENAHADSSRPTLLQRQLTVLTRNLLITCLALCAVVALAGGLIWASMQWPTLLGVTVSLAIAVIPEGLLPVLTVALSRSMARLAREHGVLARSGRTLEALAAIKVLCTDKTGTLTEGRMAVHSVFLPNGGEDGDERNNKGKELDDDDQSQGWALRCAILCNDGVQYLKGDKRKKSVETVFADLQSQQTKADAENEGAWTVKPDGDPTETALAQWALSQQKETFLARGWGLELQERLGKIPFDSERRMMTVATRDPSHADHLMVWCKGAPEVILAKCTKMMGDKEGTGFGEAKKAKIEAKVAEMSRQGLRVIALAMRHVVSNSGADDLLQDEDHVESELTFLALVGLRDPPREGAKEAVAACHSLGIHVAMITGDHVSTAVAIARSLGIIKHADDDNLRSCALQGIELDALGVQGLARMSPMPSVFARVAPHHKAMIVKAFQQRQKLDPKDKNHKENTFAEGGVAMVGDGVNDAPAIALAHVGIAMAGPGSAADVCRHVAHLLLTRDDPRGIPEAVREARLAVANVSKFCAYLLACNSAEIWCVAVPVCFLNVPPPLQPTSILWANLIADVPPSMALGAYEPQDSLVTSVYRGGQEEVLGWRKVILVLSQGILLAAVPLLLYCGRLQALGIPFFSFDGKHGSNAPTSSPSDVDAALNQAQSEAFFVLTALQLLIVFAFRSFRVPSFTNLTPKSLRERATSNKPLLVAVGVSFSLLLAGHYVPFLSDRILKLQPVSGVAWATLGIGFLVVLGGNWVVKAALFSSPSNATLSKDAQVPSRELAV